MARSPYHDPIISLVPEADRGPLRALVAAKKGPGPHSPVQGPQEGDIALRMPPLSEFLEGLPAIGDLEDLEIEEGADEDEDFEGLEISADDMVRASCAYFAQSVLTGPPETGGQFFIADHHLAWDDLLREHNRLCILAPRDHGKCGRGDELLLTADGSRVRLDAWRGGDLVVWDQKFRQFVIQRTGPSKKNGVQQVIRVRTRTGRELVVTENHPFLTWGGWVQAKDLQPKRDRIAVARRVAGVGSEVVPRAWLLGLLVGDGGLTGTSAKITTADPGVALALQAVCSEAGWELSPSKHDPYTYALAGEMGPRPDSAPQWLREHGLWGKTSHEKRVPAAIMRAGACSRGAFLSGYFDADGSVVRTGGGAAEFYSVNKALLQDVQHLLTRDGVISVLTRKRGRYKGRAHLSWRLTVRGEGLVELSRVLADLRGAKRDQLSALAQAQSEKGVTSGDSVDRFPVAVWRGLKCSEDWHRKRGGSRPQAGADPTRAKVLRVATQEGNLDLLHKAHEPVLWDQVVEAEPAGEVMTYGLQVPGHHTYVANDVINHNTYWFDFAYPLWLAVTKPGGITFIFSATATQAERILDDIRVEIETNPKLMRLVPERKAQWSTKQLRLSNGHRIYARGFGTKVRGAHPDTIIVDDGINDESIYSVTVREKQIDYFYTAISNMVTPKGKIIVIGTPFHKEDLYGSLKKNARYKFCRFRAIRPDKSPLWPERYSARTLMAKKEEIGGIRFTREFMVDPVSDDMSLFPLRLFRGAPTEQFQFTLGMPAEVWERAGITRFTAVDFAMSSSVGADYTVIWTMGVDQFGNRWIVNVQLVKGLAYQEQLSMINTEARRYDSALVLLEDNQMQRIFGDELIRTSDLPIKKFTTGVQKNSLDKGVPSLRILLENQKFRIPRGDKHSVAVMDEWIDQMRSYTWHEGKLQSVGGHDDLVMACWLCDQAIRLGAFGFSFGDEEADVDLEDIMAEMTGENDQASAESEADRAAAEAAAFEELLGIAQAQQAQEEERPGVIANLIEE